MYEKDYIKRKGVENTLQKKHIYPATVKQINDPLNSMRIKVIIPELGDETIELESLPWCTYMGDKQFFSLPKIGEAVWIHLANPDKPYTERYWSSRVISAYQNVKTEQRDEGLRGTIHSRLSPEQDVNKKPNAQNLFPNKQTSDNWLVGKNNTDIIFSDNLLTLRVGKHEKEDVFRRNKKNPAYFRMEYNNDDKTTSLLVSDQIALVSHKQVPRPNVDINEENLDSLIEELSPMVKGDVLVKILQIFKKAILNHSHKFSDLPPNENENNIVNLKRTNLNDILSENILIN